MRIRCGTLRFDKSYSKSASAQKSIGKVRLSGLLLLPLLLLLSKSVQTRVGMRTRCGKLRFDKSYSNSAGA